MQNINKINLPDFLKKYTGISARFIDKYYKFYEMAENKQFGINIDDIIDYLKLTDKEFFYN